MVTLFDKLASVGVWWEGAGIGRKLCFKGKSGKTHCRVIRTKADIHYETALTDRALIEYNRRQTPCGHGLQ
jgi:hypothetical protein